MKMITVELPEYRNKIQDSCFMCNQWLDNDDIAYVELPNGDAVIVCKKHLCRDENLDLPYGEYKDLKDIYDLIDKYRGRSNYVRAVCNELLTTMHKWQHPCYTCFTEY